MQPAEAGGAFVDLGIDVEICAGEHLAHLGGARNRTRCSPSGGRWAAGGANLYRFAAGEARAVSGGNNARAGGSRVWRRDRIADDVLARDKGIHARDQVGAPRIELDREDPRVPIELAVVVEVFTGIELAIVIRVFAEPVVRGRPAATRGVEAADRRVFINSLGIGREECRQEC